MSRGGRRDHWNARPQLLGALLAVVVLWASNLASVVSEKLWQIKDHERRLAVLEKEHDDAITKRIQGIR